MRKQIRHYFAGGNTPKGFYSFYDNILQAREAERIFCIKGGPGTGKSTLMKAIGMYFENKYHAIDYLWCSSDPDSLDGIIIKDKQVAIVDGTSPHIVDPKNPGAIDEIINLGECWNATVLRNKKNEIIKYNEDITLCYKNAYKHLQNAESYMKDMEQAIKQNYLLEVPKENTGKSFFASAVTHKGLVNTIDSLVAFVETPIIVKAPIGVKTDYIYDKAEEYFVDNNVNITKFYCPMNPNKIDHLICNDGAVGIFTINEYHKFNYSENCRIIDLTKNMEYEDNQLYSVAHDDYNKEITTAIEYFKEAKELHDALEKLYIPAMDFEKVAAIKEKIILEVESISS